MIRRLAATLFLLVIAASQPTPYGGPDTMNQGILFQTLDCGFEYRPAPALFCHVD